MDATITAFALLTGLIAGSAFSFLNIPIPAPPEMPGIMGIIGIYLGYRAIQWIDVGFNLLQYFGAH
jgi:XapX domain-containing protein